MVHFDLIVICKFVSVSDKSQYLFIYILQYNACLSFLKAFFKNLLTNDEKDEEVLFFRLRE